MIEFPPKVTIENLPSLDMIVDELGGNNIEQKISLPQDAKGYLAAKIF